MTTTNKHAAKRHARSSRSGCDAAAAWAWRAAQPARLRVDRRHAAPSPIGADETLDSDDSRRAAGVSRALPRAGAGRGEPARAGLGPRQHQRPRSWSRARLPAAAGAPGRRAGAARADGADHDLARATTTRCRRSLARIGDDRACALATRGARWARASPLARGARRGAGRRPRRCVRAARALGDAGRCRTRWDCRWGRRARRCGDCAWRYRGGRGTAASRCRQSAGADGDGQRVRRRTIRPASAGSRRWTAATCGACCREALPLGDVSACATRWSGSNRSWWCATGTASACCARADRCAALEIGARGQAAATTAGSTRIARSTCREFDAGRAPLSGGAPPGRAVALIPAMPEIVDVFVPLDERTAAGGAGGAGAGPARRRRWRRCAWCGARSTRARGGRSGYHLRARGRRAGRERRGRAATRAAPRWPAGRAGAAGGDRRLGAGGHLRGAAPGRGRRARRRSSSAASRCSRGATTWRQLQRGRVDPDSNYCFGEGGAGTYSDGKLYTRAQDAATCATCIEIWCARRAAGDPGRRAPAHRLEPAAEGGDRAARAPRGAGRELPLRARGRRVCAREGGRVRAVRLARRATSSPADAVVLATGPLGARRVRVRCARPACALERKAFAIGVRIEHPQPLIDRIQYGARRRPPDAAGRVLRAGGARRSGRGGLVLHVPGRLDRAGRDRARRASSSTA